MGRLEEIAARNKRALQGDHGIAKVIGKLDSSGPAEPDIPGMRRRTTTNPLLVIAFMVVAGSIVGFLTCRNTPKSEADLLQIERERALQDLERSKSP